MNRGEIKHRRTRRVFGETAAEMIREGGVESVSVRKVAEKAGYSLGTLYNHFSNLDDLLWLTREILIEEIAAHIISGKKPLVNADDFADSLKAYISYFTGNREIFRFFYFHQLDKNSKNESERTDRTDTRGEMAETCRFIEKMTGCREDRSPRIYRMFVYALHGMLTLSLSGNDELEAEQLNGEIDSMIELILTKKN